MKVLLTGAAGQLGSALIGSKPNFLADRPVELIAVTREELDLANPQACRSIIDLINPDWVLNAGAYTAVDKAESDQDMAYKVNAEAPEAFAAALDQCGGRLLQLSTDFVFNGQKSSPYLPQDSVAPLGVYGSSKAAGEQGIFKQLKDRAYVLRTGWVYGPVGNNFLLTMLKLHELKASSGETLNVVADQVGCPTSTLGLAKACWKLIEMQTKGAALAPIHHWSDSGVASWYDFAVAIGELGKSLGLLTHCSEVLPIKTSDYPTKAKRPSFSLLDTSLTRLALDLEADHWRKALYRVLSILKTA